MKKNKLKSWYNTTYSKKNISKEFGNKGDFENEIR